MKKTVLLYFSILLVFSQITAQQTVGVFLNDSLSVNGYTLFGKGTNTYLIDNCGFVVNSWESNFISNSAMYLLENGNLLRTCRIGGSFSGGGVAGRIELTSWEGDLLWFYNYATSEYHQHHDIELLPNGNILLIAWESRSQIEAVSAGRDPLTISANGIWPEQIVELEMVGNSDANIVWEWHVWDHLIQDFDSTKANYGIIAEHPELVNINYGNAGIGTPGSSADWLHFNAIAYNPELDQIAVSSRHFNEIWIIDHSTTSAEAASHAGGNTGKGGDLLYRWGNPLVYDRGTVDNQTLFGQHNISWILEENHPYYGKLLAYNNGGSRPDGSYSTIDIWTPPTDIEGNYLISEDEPFGPDLLDWYFEEPDFFSVNVSGVHPLPNGNQLICEGTDGRLFEVTLDKEIVWEYISPIASQGGPVEQGQTPPNNSLLEVPATPLTMQLLREKI